MSNNNSEKALIISPSGNFYGSEQVLMDYLIFSKKKSDVIAPSGSAFFRILSEKVKDHDIMSFNSASVSLFYAKVFYWLVIGRYNVVYLNEAGHSKYILALSKIFKSIKFVIHVRIREDTDESRWINPGSNVVLIAISKFIKALLAHPSVLMYDPYFFSDNSRIKNEAEPVGIIRVGIIGRLSYSKGIVDMVNLLQYISENNVQGFQFLLFGDEGSDIRGTGLMEKIKGHPSVFFKGFEPDKDTLYNQIDIVLHLSRTEPLGRIFFEAIDKGKPFIGYNSAGIGEIGMLSGLQSLLVDAAADENVSSQIIAKLEFVRDNYVLCVQEIFQKKSSIETVFNIKQYSEKLDNILLVAV